MPWWSVSGCSLPMPEPDGRSAGVVQELFACLKNAGVPGDWQHILNQIGMFSYTGLSKPQVQVGPHRPSD